MDYRFKGVNGDAFFCILATRVLHTVEFRPLTFTNLTVAILILCGLVQRSVTGCDFCQRMSLNQIPGVLCEQVSQATGLNKASLSAQLLCTRSHYKETPKVVKTKQTKQNFFFFFLNLKRPSNESFNKI